MDLKFAAGTKYSPRKKAKQVTLIAKIITVENTGDEERTYILSATTPTESWRAIVDPSITLDGGDNKKVTLKITPPTDVYYEEDGYEIQFTATDNEEELKSQSINLKVYIQAKYGIQLSIQKNKAEIDKEEDAEYYIDVKSNCNVEVTIELSINKIPDWEAKLETYSVRLNPFQSIEFYPQLLV